jgi:putative transposase
MTIPKSLSTDLIDSLLSDYKKPEDLIGEHGLLKQLTKALVERALQAEIAEHLGHDSTQRQPIPLAMPEMVKAVRSRKVNSENCPSRSPVTVKAVSSHKSFPSIKTRWVGFDDKIISLYARGMTVREIQQHLTECMALKCRPCLFLQLLTV